MKVSPELVAAVTTALIKQDPSAKHNATLMAFCHDWLTHAWDLAFYQCGKPDAVQILLHFCRLGNITPSEELVCAIIEGRDVYKTTISAPNVGAETQQTKNKKQS